MVPDRSDTLEIEIFATNKLLKLPKGAYTGVEVVANAEIELIDNTNAINKVLIFILFPYG